MHRQSFLFALCRSRFYILVMRVLFIACLLSGNAAPAASTGNDAIDILLGSGSFGINYDPVVHHIYIWFDKHNARYDDDWEISQITPDLYQMRSKTWKDFFWQVDTAKKEAWKISNGSFGAPGGSASRLEETSVLIFQQKDRDRIPPFGLRFTNAKLSYRKNTREVTVTAEGAVVSSPGDWIAAQVDANTLHLKNARPNLLKGGKNFFLKIDAIQGQAYRISDGTFGSAGGEELLLSDAALRPKGKLYPVEEDLGAKKDKPSPLPSPWIDSEKSRYRAVLKQGTYDVLVVPFQVKGYAIDRPGRALMTRYLVDRIERTTDNRVPSCGMVSKALGESLRTFNVSDIYSLANELKVKMLVTGFVGHHRDEKLDVTLLVQVRDQTGWLKPSTKTTRIERKDVPFDDEHIPSEVFSELLDGLMNELPVHQIRTIRPKTYKKERTVLPAGIKEITDRVPANPVASAYSLQLLGMLYPEDNAAREYLFERSLVSLQGVSHDSPDYVLLKARAYFYLHRRPAALAVLSSPSTHEEQALFAVLNGDLPKLSKEAEEIREPLPRLLAQIELVDLLWQYDQYRAKKTIPAIVHGYTGWDMLVERRLRAGDAWSVQSNVPIKKALDALLPVPDFTIESIARSSIARGDRLRDNTELEFSVQNHCARLLTDEARKFLATDSALPVLRDLVDLMAAIGESNLMKMATFRIKTQSLYEEGLNLLNRYELLYRGHPQISYLRSVALLMQAGTKQDLAADNLEKTAKDLAYQACWLSQGQDRISLNVCAGHALYDGDYPQRFYWSPSAESVRDRVLPGGAENRPQFQELPTEQRYALQNLEQSLRYANADFLKFEAYHAKIKELKLTGAADGLVRNIGSRFAGNMQRSAFLAKQLERTGDAPGAQKIYEETIAANRTSWEPYRGLGLLYVKQGDFKKASATFGRYPFFQETLEEIRSNDDVNVVALSQYAYAAGRLLWWSGAIPESVTFFKRSSGYQSGSGAGMRSATILALIDKDYNLALQSSLMTAKRYNQTSDYAVYIGLLHAMGFHQEAWSVQKTFHKKTINDDDWSPVLVGHRMEGKAEDEQLSWFMKNFERSNSRFAKQQYVFISHVLDRSPESKLSERLETLGVNSAGENTNGDGEQSSGTGQPGGSPAQTIKEKSFFAWFADGYCELKRKNFTKAYSVLGERMTRDEYILSKGHALPYFIWAGVKGGKSSEMEPIVQAYRDRYGEDFDYHLMESFLSAGRKKNLEALNHLKAAQYVLPDKLDERAIYPLYQLLESCEWLYEETGYDGYRAVALLWAKLYQQLRPTFAWTYAIEAKYTTNKEDRRRALALTLYFDRRSERIMHFSEREKAAAMEWLKYNNPFSIPQRSVRSKDI